ncbi:MAG: hypothetical protein A4E43_00665 [Methanosaeta sp. PtaB.Bin005]|jgi:hypothetical protein|nr:MAG: hypothetical protein A4E43_00665 [Methanosaeta sp. PtaB.Bin005]
MMLLGLKGTVTFLPSSSVMAIISSAANAGTSITAIMINKAIALIR